MKIGLRRRYGMLLMGVLATVEARAAFLPVCDRTPAVKQFLEQALSKGCSEITAEDLLGIKRVAVGHKGIAAFKADDFSGLSRLEILNIRSNPYTLLPEGLFKDLGELKTLVIISTSLRHYPDDFLAHNPRIQDLHIFGNQVRGLSESVFQRLAYAKELKIIDIDETLQPAEKARLRQLFPENGKVALTFE